MYFLTRGDERIARCVRLAVKDKSNRGNCIPLRLPDVCSKELRFDLSAL